MLTETKVECFLTAARTLSFTETSRELCITQQAVSSSISALEQEFGFALFNRTSRTVTLTPEGQRCYEMFRQVKKEIEDTIFEIKVTRSMNNTVLRLGYQEWLDFGLGPGMALKEIRKSYPGLQLSGERFPPTSLKFQLLTHKLDLIFMYKTFFECLDFPEAEISYIDLIQTQRSIFVSVNHSNLTEDSTFEDFVREPLLFDLWSNESPDEGNRRLTSTIRKWKLEPKSTIMVTNRDSGYTAAGLGDGIIASSEINRISERSTLKRFLIPDSFETVVCIWATENKKPELLEFINCLKGLY